MVLKRNDNHEPATSSQGGERLNMAPYLDQPEDTSGANATPTTKLQHIHCSGTPYEIGHTHGRNARVQIARTIQFYAEKFHSTAKLDWTHVREVAMTYEPVMRHRWPEYLEEITGVADGARVQLADIVACNVRTEIAFGLWSDGCTALSWTPPESVEAGAGSFLGQNWDWETEQKGNLVMLTIDQSASRKPTVKMVTEAGLIGKIGLNSAGVGVCLNAIRVKGMDPTRVPCHLGLRMVLDAWSREEAVRRLESYGVASSCHMLVADATGGVGLEWSAVDLRKCQMNERGQVFHSNHYLERHEDPVADSYWLDDSEFRVARIEELAKRIEKPEMGVVKDIFKDEKNYPGSICRGQKAGSTVESLFNIVMDLKAKRADITIGRPTEPEGVVQFAF